MPSSTASRSTWAPTARRRGDRDRRARPRLREPAALRCDHLRARPAHVLDRRERRRRRRARRSTRPAATTTSARQSYPADALALTLDGGEGDDELPRQPRRRPAPRRRRRRLRHRPAGDDVARLGGGDDIFRWDPGEGSDAVAGQGAATTRSASSAPAPPSASTCARSARDVRLTRDVGAIVMDLGGVERISDVRSRPARTPSTIGDLSGTPMTGSDWSLGALDGAADRSPSTARGAPTPSRHRRRAEPRRHLDLGGDPRHPGERARHRRPARRRARAERARRRGHARRLRAHPGASAQLHRASPR